MRERRRWLLVVVVVMMSIVMLDWRDTARALAVGLSWKRELYVGFLLLVQWFVWFLIFVIGATRRAIRRTEELFAETLAVLLLSEYSLSRGWSHGVFSVERQSVKRTGDRAVSSAVITAAAAACIYETGSAFMRRGQDRRRSKSK
jgi:hypothetical protein